MGLSDADHYCIFELKPDGLEMKAFTFDGKLLDTRLYKPRK